MTQRRMMSDQVADIITTWDTDNDEMSNDVKRMQFCSYYLPVHLLQVQRSLAERAVMKMNQTMKVPQACKMKLPVI